MRTVTHAVLARLTFLLTLLPACDGGAPDGPCDPATSACVLAHDFGLQTLESGQEADDLCQSWTLGNETELWVSSVRFENDGGYHHSNWFFVPDDTFELPDGGWQCGDHDFAELTAAILGGVLYAQSTQTELETQQFGPAVAVRIPPRSRVIGSTHLLNVGDATLTTGLRMTLETLPPGELAVKLAPFRLTYYDLHLPPGARSEFSADCDIDPAHRDVTGLPLDLTLHYLLPHFHYDATGFQVSLLGGARDGEVLHRTSGYADPVWGKAFLEPVDLAAAGATGFSFSCTYDNPRDRVVGWGNRDGEMCMILGFADTAIAFDASVNHGAGAVTAVTDGVTHASGPCTVLGLSFDQTKEGGR